MVSPADATRSPRHGLRNAPHRLSSATAPFSSPLSGTWVGYAGAAGLQQGVGEAIEGCDRQQRRRWRRQQWLGASKGASNYTEQLLTMSPFVLPPCLVTRPLAASSSPESGPPEAHRNCWAPAKRTEDKNAEIEQQRTASRPR